MYAERYMTMILGDQMAALTPAPFISLKKVMMMKVRIIYNDDCGCCVSHDDVWKIVQYDNEIVVFFEPYSKYAKTHEYVHIVLNRNKIKHLKVLFD